MFRWDQNSGSNIEVTGFHFSVFLFYSLHKNISPWVLILASQLIKPGIDVSYLCFETNVKNVTSFLSNKWIFEQIDTDFMYVVVLGQNTVKLKVNIVWVVSMILTNCLAVITKFYLQEDVSIPFTGKGFWFAIYAIRMKLNKHWKRWRSFQASEKKRVSARTPKIVRNYHKTQETWNVYIR